MSASTLAAMAMRQRLEERRRSDERVYALIRRLRDEGVLEGAPDLMAEAMDLETDLAIELTRRIP